jgi:hypothetical protein
MRRPVPPGFTLPTANVRQMWELWHFGNRAIKVGPYKRIHGDDLYRKVDKVGLTRLRSVIMRLEEIGLANQGFPAAYNGNVSTLTRSQFDKLYHVCYGYLIRELYGNNVDVANKANLSYNTLYTNMTKH